MNLAWQRAKVVWEKENPDKSFDTLVSRYLTQGGIVWSSPEQFLLACPVVIHEDGTAMHDEELGDTWLIHLAALAEPAPKPDAVLAAFVRLAPRPLPWVAWHRRRSKRLHRHAWERVLTHIDRMPAPPAYEHVR